ncbi:MAG: M48 family metalloprotease [Acidobacteriota bacterium]
MRLPTISSRVLLLIAVSWLLCLPPWEVQAQRQAESAHVNLYFAQVADGQFGGGRWQTAFTLVNTNDTDAAAEIRLFGGDGGELPVDFGTGLASRFSIVVPAKSSLTLSTRPTTFPVRSGWARVYSDVPLVGSASFRLWLGPNATQEVTAPPTLPVIDYVSYANRDLGVAVANPNNRTLQVDAHLKLKNGDLLGPSRITLPPFGHTAFNVRERFPAADLNDSVLTLAGVGRPNDEFLAWTMNADPSGTFSSIPPGGVTPPISHWDRIWNSYLRVLKAAKDLDMLQSEPDLEILYDQTVNAYALGGREVGIFIGLSELLGDSDSELAFVAGHELGHIYQQRTGRLEFHNNPEFDADIWGTLLTLASGYDVYAAAGALSKLAMATGTAGLSTQFEQQLSSDAHKSFNTRISEVYEMLQIVCSMPEAAPACSEYKKTLHPHLPGSAPLNWDDLAARGYRRPELLQKLKSTGGSRQSRSPQAREKH